MRTDTIFYQLFQTLPSIVFELIGQPGALAAGYQFTSQEVKELARRFDGVFLPPEGDIDAVIYFVEVEFQRKDDFYWRFFTEIFVYLGQYKPAQNWRAVAIFANRSFDPGIPRPYQQFFTQQSSGVSPLLQRVYLDELGEPANLSLELGMVKLVVEDEETAVEQARELIGKARQEISDAAFEQKVVALIETIMVYKLPQFSRQEIEAMFGLQELKQTRYFQEVRAEAKEEGKLEGKLEAKLESVPRLLAVGLTVEQIAQVLELDVEVVRQAAREP